MSQFNTNKIGCTHCSPQYDFDININTPTLDVFGSTEYGYQTTLHRPTRTALDDHLEKCGIEYPKVPCPGAGYYFDIHGNMKRADLNFPWMLVTYAPRKMEKHYQTLENALLDVPSSTSNGYLWRIIHTINGEIAYEVGKHQ